jgi:hypothetical protein
MEPVNYWQIYRLMESFYAAHHTTGVVTSPAPVGKQEKHKVANIPANFRKNLKWPQQITQGPGETDSWKKPEVENLVSDSL